MKKQLQSIFNALVRFCLAACVLTVLHYVLLVTSWSSFNVPSTSMLPTLQPGDYMLVNKWVMGARIYDLHKAAGKIPIRVGYAGKGYGRR